MQTNKKSLPMRLGAYLMLVLSTFGWPAMWHTAYAQRLPEIMMRSDSVDLSWMVSQLDNDVEQALINKRAARLLRVDNEPEFIRAPRIDQDNTQPRLPRLDQSPDDILQAERQASRINPLERSEIVEGAQKGSDAGQSMMGKVDNVVLDTERVDPGLNQTSAGRINVTEMLPGYTAQGAAEIRAEGMSAYNDPEKLKMLSEQNSRNLRKEGCRKTTFVAKELQNIDFAGSGARHRILKVEFFDIQKTPIHGTNPVKYQSITVPSVYKRGTVNMDVATLGASSSVYWDYVDDEYAIKYTYTPFTAPKNRNHFTYNHRFAADHGAGPLRIFNPGLVSYGSPQDGWTPVTTRPLEIGIKAAYLSADLYQADVVYTKEIDGQPCPLDPPQHCEVPSRGGETIRWCPGAFGANVAWMYDDQMNPDERKVGKKYNDMASNNASRKNYTQDSALRAGVSRGLNAGSSAKAQELAGTCRRDAVSRIEINRGRSYRDPDMSICSNTLINPFPNGCNTMKRAFGLVYLGEHNFLTVRAFNKIKVPIIDPVTNNQAKNSDGDLLYTYRREPANVSGSIRTDFSIMGFSACFGGSECSTEIPDDPTGGSEGYYVEYTHTPMGGEYMGHAFDRVYVEGGGSGSFSHYGSPEEAWVPTGSAFGDGTLHQLKLMAKAYMVPSNNFAGCQNYIKYVADNFCRGGKLTCVDAAPTRTVGGVTFGPGLPNSGIVDLLKQWGTDATAIVDDIYDGEGENPIPTGPPLIMIADKMCWEAQGEPFTSCETMQDDGSLKHFFRGEALWGTDCHIVTDDNGVPLENSPSCRRAPQYDSCDSRLRGVFTGVCYNENVSYDCGRDVHSRVPILMEEQADSCTGVVRCMGTECHRPNLSGNHGESFVRAMSGMEALNFMMSEMICAETGEPPVSPEQQCTPTVFGGKPMYCKKPIGRQIGLTPDCCKEVKKAAKGGPSWIDYMNATQALYKIARNETFQNFLGGFDVYNNTAATFGEMARPITDAYSSASSWVTENVVKPFSSGFDNMFGSFSEGFGASSGAVADIGTGAAAKQGMISGAIDQLKTKLMNAAYEVLKQISPDLAAGIFTNGGTAAVAFTESAKEILNAVNMVFMVYSIARLIGQIIFACKQEEYEWGMNDNWRLCTYVDSCCSKKALFVCVEKRLLYCCYKSIATRVISEQIVKKNLTGTRPRGYRTGADGRSLNKCNINCGGISPMELAIVDWSRVDLTEWTDVMIESGMLNSSDPRQSFGVTSDSVPLTEVLADVADEDGSFDQRSSAFKTVEGWRENLPSLASHTETLRDEGVEHCYDPENDKKMPFTYPGCRNNPSTP